MKDNDVVLFNETVEKMNIYLDALRKQLAEQQLLLSKIRSGSIDVLTLNKYNIIS